MLLNKVKIECYVQAFLEIITTIDPTFSLDLKLTANFLVEVEALSSHCNIS